MIYLALNCHRRTDNCCIKLEKATLKGSVDLVVDLLAINLSDRRLSSDQRPKLSTTKGKKVPPADSTSCS